MSGPRGQSGGLGAAIERELSRRGFIARAGGATLGLAALVRVLAALDADAALAQMPREQRLLPTHADVRATVEALADTIIPGPAGGADRHAGAIEAGAVEEAYDPFYGVVTTFPALHADLQTATPLILGRPVGFDLELPYRDRERVVLDRITNPSNGGGNSLALAYIAFGILVWQAYYGVAQTGLGLRYAGLPPHSDGYWPTHSYRVRFRGMTRDGNPL